MKSLRGINLGGWLVAERWMTPELFVGSSAIDEYGLHADTDEQMGQRVLRHHQEFITKQDIEQIAQAGFQMVRVPVGYWLWERTEGYIYDPKIVDSVLDWCGEAGLDVVLSLHGAPGSQNGWDHSGRIGNVAWATPDNIQKTLRTIDHIADRYGRHEALIGLGVLNEPHPDIELDILMDYYAKAAAIVKRLAAASVRVILSDSFRPLEVADGMQQYGLGDCVLDMHLYQTFTAADQQLTFDQHIRKVESEWRELLTQLGARVDVMVGEWSAMLAAETFTGMSDVTRRGMVKRYYDVQQNVFTRHAWGWAYWTYKTGGPSVWNWSVHQDLGLA